MREGTVSIRRAQTTDIPGIKRVLEVTWRDTYSALLSESSIAEVTTEWHSPKALEEEVNRPTTFAAVAESSSAGIVAMITAHLHEEVLVVARLYVLPEFQRQGIGSRLLAESYRAFPQTRRVTLNVEEQNPKGLAFYRKLGFTWVGDTTDNVAGTLLKSAVMEKHMEYSART